MAKALGNGNASTAEQVASAADAFLHGRHAMPDPARCTAATAAFVNRARDFEPSPSFVCNCRVTGRRSVGEWNWMTRTQCEDWVLFGDLTVEAAERIMREHAITDEYGIDRLARVYAILDGSGSSKADEEAKLHAEPRAPSDSAGDAILDTAGDVAPLKTSQTATGNQVSHSCFECHCFGIVNTENR